MNLPPLPVIALTILCFPVVLIPGWLGLYLLVGSAPLPGWFRGILASGILAARNVLRGYFSISDVIFLIGANLFFSFMCLIAFSLFTHSANSDNTASYPIKRVPVENPTNAVVIAPSTSHVPDLTISPIGSFRGSWFHNFGMLTLNQSGADISGTYYNGFAHANGTITGRVTDKTLIGTWSILGESGSMRLTLGINEDKFDGQWAGGNFPTVQKWCGARSGIAFPLGCGFAGQWFVDVSGVGTGVMNLSQTNNFVSGTYFKGTLNGNLALPGDGALQVLSGSWRGINNDTGHLTFYLLGLNGLEFQGNWNDTNAWCGWRSESSKPLQCLR